MATDEYPGSRKRNRRERKRFLSLLFFFFAFSFCQSLSASEALAEDESLVGYKQALADAETADYDASGPKVVVEKLSLVVQGRPDVDLDLTGDLTKLKDEPFILKEGAQYRLRITFQVLRENAYGLKYFQVTYRKDIRVDKSSFMVGSYGPREEPYVFLTPPDEAPKGVLARGHYTVRSKFTDDDKISYLQWKWSFDIKKDWE